MIMLYAIIMIIVRYINIFMKILLSGFMMNYILNNKKAYIF